MQGKIIKGIAGFYYVYGEDEVLYECKAKGIFRKDNQKPLVGDNVEITILDQQEQTGNLIRILPRKNSLIRPAVANVDQAFVIFALENPMPRRRFHCEPDQVPPVPSAHWATRVFSPMAWMRQLRARARGVENGSS